MSDKIIVVSMAKNESDIIESFVRYYMTFVDGMVIVDHNSDDDTGKMLAALQEEYPSLIVEQLNSIEYTQSDVMTKLVNRAATEMGADWILPIDIDEYLIPNNDTDCRSMLGRISDEVISLNWIDHELADTEHDRDVFLLSRSCNRAKNANIMTKIFVRGNLVRRAKVRLLQGNHGVLVQQDNGKEMVADAPRSSVFTLAHFPFRSQEQYISKNAVGWLSNTMKYSAMTISALAWKKEFDKICANQYEVPTLPDSTFIGKLYEGNIKLKYTASTPINVLSRILKLAEKICDKYAKENAIRNISPVTVIMPLNQDFEGAVDTIESLLGQTFEKWKLIIIASDDIDEGIKKALLECDSRISIVGINDNIAPEGFVKLISPGVILFSDCIEKEALALYIHNEFNVHMTYSNSRQVYGLDVVADTFSARPGIDIWNSIKDDSRSLTGGISGMMLRSIPRELQLSKVLEDYKWKEKEIMGLILPQNVLLVFPEPLL